MASKSASHSQPANGNNLIQIELALACDVSALVRKSVRSNTQPPNSAVTKHAIQTRVVINRVFCVTVLRNVLDDGPEASDFSRPTIQAIRSTERKQVERDRVQAQKIQEVKDDYQDRLTERLEIEVENMKEMYGEILARLPNVTAHFGVGDGSKERG